MGKRWKEVRRNNVKGCDLQMQEQERKHEENAAKRKQKK